MSLLNRPSDGTHSVLIVLYKLLLEEGAMPRDRIIGVCAPPVPPDDEKEKGPGAMVGSTLRTWSDFGLFDDLPGGNITLSKKISRSEHGLDRLPHLARRLVMEERNNPDLWKNEGAKASDFSRAVSWLLAQDVYALALTGWTSAENLLKNQVPVSLRAERDLGLIQNDTRWAGLKAWATWLGFAWRGRNPSDVLTIDPTVAVLDALPGVFGRKRKLAASELIAGLAEALPVLDGGTYRRDVEAKLNSHTGSDAWQPLPGGQVSTSLSRVMLRLMQSGVLAESMDADAKDRIALTGRDRRVIASVTHFTFNS